jgi:anaerobic magnesium-protoporphyrin IX monomethyl ester cyclase
MRVLLVNPKSNDLYTRVGAKMPPLGITYLAAVLRERGHQPEIVDMNVSPPVETYAGYDLVGISSLTCNYNAALEVAAAAKKDGAQTVMGGYHVTFMDAEALGTGVVDYVIRGEADYAMSDLADRIEANQSLDGLEGLSFVKNGEVIRFGGLVRVPEVESVPFPARDLLQLSGYNALLDERPMTTIITSRGCPYNCFFCSSSNFGGRVWRARSPQSVIDEVEHVCRQYGFQAIDFMDDNFTLDPKRAIAICDEIERRKLDIAWWALSRADTIVNNEPMVKRMAETGLRMLFLGMESADEEVLKSYHKKAVVEQFYEAMAILRKYRVLAWASFMIGGLTETKQAILKTVHLAKRLDPHSVQFSILTPFPGTALFNAVKDRLVFHPVYLSPRELQQYLVKAYHAFYLRPSKLLREFLDAIRKRRVMRTIFREPFRAMIISRSLAKQSQQT